MHSQPLQQLLRTADLDDLAVLVRILTDNGKGRISLDNAICRQLHDLAVTTPPQPGLRAVADLVAREIEHFGGNSIINFFRGKGVTYDEIVRDVASHLKVNFNTAHSTADVEVQVLIKILEQSLQEMSADQRVALMQEIGRGSAGVVGPAGLAGLQAAVAAGGFAAYRVSLIVANAVARQLTGRGLALAANAGIARGIGVFAGPIGWAITVIWTAFELAAPAYRVTVPCVVMVAYMRQKQITGGEMNCPSCNTAIGGQVKYCPECGHKIR